MPPWGSNILSDDEYLEALKLLKGDNNLTEDDVNNSKIMNLHEFQGKHFFDGSSSGNELQLLDPDNNIYSPYWRNLNINFSDIKD